MSFGLDFDTALRLTEAMMALAFIQQSIEHVFKGAGSLGDKRERLYHLLRMVLCAFLLVGMYAPFMCLALVGLSALILQRFDGPYNGGSDRMGLLILLCATLAHWLPDRYAELALGYLALQLVLSYFISGYVKIVNPAWRRGQALIAVFDYSAYPVSQDLRGLAARPRLLWLAAWGVMVFELIFPLMMLTQLTLGIALVIAAAFHGANAFLFGLNRFFWIWLCAYPSIIWLQSRLMGTI